ncbi:MAG: sensor domain-containing diguanylate cyclase, partial [Chitinivibrionales bacterium]|nr:sensor domain-containing diguanylate cyclase [Chitinivibrionales bacterium]
LQGLIAESKKNQVSKSEMISTLGSVAYRTLSAMSIVGIIVAILVTGVIANGIRSSIGVLKSATGYVSEGKFENLPMVKNDDELGELSLAFNHMAGRLQQLEQIYMDASPLTHLPGGIAVENSLKKRIDANESFAFCLLDLDNFKPFNDRYGYGRGNDVIKKTALIIHQCSKNLGTEDDFVGHIGGDDFALITIPPRCIDICNEIIVQFDRHISEFYNPQDRQNGYIISKNRQGETLKFPIMTISIAIVNSEKTFVESYIQVGEIAAELKKYAKSFQQSNVVIDRRGSKKPEETGGSDVQDA